MNEAVDFLGKIFRFVATLLVFKVDRQFYSDSSDFKSFLISHSKLDFVDDGLVAAVLVPRGAGADRQDRRRQSQLHLGRGQPQDDHDG